MLNHKRLLAVVPARGGSKGIPLKNLREVGGVSLVARVGQVVQRVPEIDRAVVSTDHEAIAAAAEAAGLAAPFRRPPHLSGDLIGDVDVLTHALVTMEALDGVIYNVVLMLQPTSPMRRPEDVTRCIRLLVDHDFDAVWTVSPTDLKNHPLKQLTVDGDRLGYFDPRGASIIARQQLTPVYHRNGAAYAVTRNCLLEQKTIMGRRSGAVVLSADHVSIDTEADLARAEKLLAARTTEEQAAANASDSHE